MLLMSGFFMFAVIGGISLLAHYYTLNGIKSKTVGDGQHGTARFATREEIKDTYCGEKGNICQKHRALFSAVRNSMESFMP